MSCGDIFLGLIAILFPPIVVWIKSGLCTADSLINILLCMLGYLPGLLHAWYIIAKHPEYDYDPIDDTEAGGPQRVTYYYITHEQQQQQRTAKRSNQPRNYGTSGSGRPAPPVPGNRPHNEPAGPSAGAGSGQPSAPPSYADAVKGDNKIQSQD